MKNQRALPERSEKDRAHIEVAIGETPAIVGHSSGDVLWATLRAEAQAAVDNDHRLAQAMKLSVLNHPTFTLGLAYRFAETLANNAIDAKVLTSLSLDVFHASPEILEFAILDLQAVYDRDPSTSELLIPFLYFKGFLALQSHRIAHWLWQNDKRHMARHVQSRACEVLSVDIHPAARMGSGIMLDHGNGLVIGETAVVDDDVSILQDVTLGGTGKETGDRHPKIRRGALIGAGAKILGSIEIGIGAKVGAGSVVVSPVAAHTSVAGVPARVVGKPKSDLPGITMEEPTTGSDYVI